MATQTTSLTRQQPLNIARSGDDLANLQRLANLLSASGYFQDAREMAQAAVKVMAGQELGIPAIASMMGISIIKGKVALGAHLIASRVRAHGYDFQITRHDNTGCSITFKDKQGGVLGESTFTEADAKAAQVFSDMYKKYPKNMYYARSMSNGAKWFTPEVLAGMPVFTPEELGAKVDGDGEIVHDSTAAQKEVLETKLAAMQSGKSYAEASAPEPDFNQEVPVGEPNLPGLLAAMTDFKSCMTVLAEMKRQFVARCPEKEYYDILKNEFNLEHANQVKSVATAKKLLTALFGYWHNARACEEPEAPQPEAVTV